MRLTVFNINDIDLNTYKKSYDRVIDEMRHRGIGTYLFTQSVSALLKRYKNVRVSETLYQDRKILQDFINIFDHKNYVFLDLNIKGNPNCRTN